ncbi:MAG: type II TA system antitoxin MqsA family protein [Pseudomonadota bacterium]
MNSFCPNCEGEQPVRAVRKRELHRIRDLDIELDAEFYECLNCGVEFDDPRSDDSAERAYREYRRLKGMVQPEGVREFRKRYGLTQHELANLLGWGAATLSRYENGALQDDAHDRALQMVLEPRNLKQLIERHPDALAEEKRREIMQEISSESTAAAELLEIIESRLGRYEPSALNGYRRFSIDKFVSAILYFCNAERGASKTKLNKLLWYADGRHFKLNGVSITGVRYAHCPHGPAPDKFELLFTFLLEGSNELKREDRSDGFWSALVATRAPNMNIFGPSELSALVQTYEHFKDFNANRIRDFSHEEDGYRLTSDGEIISYELTRTLRV